MSKVTGETSAMAPFQSFRDTVQVTAATVLVTSLAQEHKSDATFLPST